MKRLLYILFAALWTAAPLTVSAGAPNDDQPRTEARPLSPEVFGQLAAAGDSCLSHTQAPKTISAQDLWAELNDADTTQPYVISVRHLEDDSARGHIPGAVHWDYTSLTNPALHHLLPQNKKIVVYCYAGQTSSFAAGYLNMVGYNAYNLKWGMSGWTSDTAIVGAGGAWYSLQRSPQDLETTTREFAREYPFPTPVCSASDLQGMITERCNTYFQAGYKSKIASWSMVSPSVYDADSTNDYIIVSYMPRSQYNAGHIRGSYCVEPGRLGTAENLRCLPPDKPIMIACSDGHASGAVCLYLRMLGYDAWSLRFGANAVTDNPAILGAGNIWGPSLAQDYPLEKGAIERH